MRMIGAASSILVAFALACASACGSGASSPAPEPTPCTDDLDCGPQRFCTDAQICRTDCFTDADCIGLGAGAECNAHGRCISGVDEAGMDEAGGDAGSFEAAEGGP
jgi:hypothetical protein